MWHKKESINEEFCHIAKKDDFLLNFRGNGTFGFSNDEVIYEKMDIKYFNGKGILI